MAGRAGEGTTRGIGLARTRQMPIYVPLHRDVEHIAFVGETGPNAPAIARALEALGYLTSKAPTVGEVAGARPPVALILPVEAGADPYREVRAVRGRPRFADALVFVSTPVGFASATGLAIAAGADDVLEAGVTVDDAVDRIAGRLLRSRRLHDRASFDCVTQVRGRRFVEEWLSAEVALAVAEHGKAALGVLVLSGFATARAEHGFRATERDVEDIAFALAAAVRPCDLPCRLSDDTFLVVVRGVGARGAATLLQSAYARMMDKAKLVRDIAIGIAEAPDEGVAWQALFDRGEERLRRGRTTQPARPTEDVASL
jgi:GGDEF domain-containing protein